MGYSENKPFENREHMLAEIGYCGKMAWILTILCLACVAIGIIGDLLSMKLLLGATSWMLLAVVFGVLSLAPHLYRVMARHLLGMELIKKERK